MSIDLNLPSLMRIELPTTSTKLDHTPRGGVIAGMNEGEAPAGTAKPPDGEHAARLRSQAPLLATRAEGGLSQMALHSTNLAITSTPGRVEAGGAAGQAAVADLAAVPALLTTLHVGTMPAPQQKKVQEERVLRKEGEDTPGGNRESPSGEEAVVAEEGRGQTADTGRQYDALYSDIHEALLQGGQEDVLRQLQGTRRVMVIFPAGPFRYGRELEAWACLLWNDPEGFEHAVAIPARLDWSARCAGDWVTLRGYRERAGRGGWRLRLHPLHPPQGGVSIRLGATPPATGEEGIRVEIPDATRFWSALGQQFSVQIALAAAPLLS